MTDSPAVGIVLISSRRSLAEGAAELAAQVSAAGGDRRRRWHR